MNKPLVITIAALRPDLVRLSEIIPKLDSNFNHILVHTGQHYDNMLSDVFFKDLEIRKPDFNLGIGGPGKQHYHQVADGTIAIHDLFLKENINPDMILFLGDSNSVGLAFPLKKSGYRIGHIEALMRSYDRRMLEEINRVVCDHCSTLLYTYHKDYKKQGIKEDIDPSKIVVCGNTIVEVCNKYAAKIKAISKKNSHIILDIHRPENFKDANRLYTIFDFASESGKRYNLPVIALPFHGLLHNLSNFGITVPKNIEFCDLMSYTGYLQCQYNAKFMISDSGTAQEEAPLLDTKVIVPRDFTERPQSYIFNCSISFAADKTGDDYIDECEQSWKYIENNDIVANTDWLLPPDKTKLTSDIIVNDLKQRLI